jgi:hypothetical protein
MPRPLRVGGGQIQHGGATQGEVQPRRLDVVHQCWMRRWVLAGANPNPLVGYAISDLRNPCPPRPLLRAMVPPQHRWQIGKPRGWHADVGGATTFVGSRRLSLAWIRAPNWWREPTTGGSNHLGSGQVFFGKLMFWTTIFDHVMVITISVPIHKRTTGLTFFRIISNHILSSRTSSHTESSILADSNFV